MGLGSQEALYRGVASQPPARYVQYKPQIITTAKEEGGGRGRGLKWGKQRKGNGIKFHIFTTFI